MKNKNKVLFSFALALGVAVTMLALVRGGVLAQSGNGPIVIINAPPSNSNYLQGDIISIDSVSASPNGIVQVDLLVDGQIVATNVTPGDLPDPQFNLIQRWIANFAGTHTITVRATDSENQVGTAAITLNIASNASTPIPAPTLTPTPPPTPNTCVLSARFLQDVTIPDNTIIAPGGTFVKTWLLQNNGTCAWDNSTVAVFVGGARMAGASPTPVGTVPPGGTVNLSINFVAPTSPGTYRSSWKLQASNGSQFGQAFYVQILLPAPPTPIPPPPPPPTPIPPIGGCQGAPQISYFTVDNGTIQRGQSTTLRWGIVLNADSAYLETPDGTGGVPTPGQTGVQPNNTTTYTLAAYCKGILVQQQVTVNVQGGGGGGGAKGSINGVTVGKKNGQFQVRVLYTWNGAGGPAEVCASAPGSDSRPCTNARPNAPYANLNLVGKNIGQVTACLLDKNGSEVACGSN